MPGRLLLPKFMKTRKVHRPPSVSIFCFSCNFCSPSGLVAFHTPAPFPIRFGRSPQVGHLPIRFPRIRHTIHKLQRIRPQTRRDQRVQFHRSPTNPVKQTSRTCVTIQQIKNQPVPANATDLRLGGGAVTSCAHVHCHAHGHGHARTFKGTRTAKRTPSRAYLHGHDFDETSGSGSRGSSANPAHSNVLRLRNTSADLQSNCYSKHLGGMGDDGVDGDDRGGAAACYSRA